MRNALILLNLCWAILTYAQKKNPPQANFSGDIDAFLAENLMKPAEKIPFNNSWDVEVAILHIDQNGKLTEVRIIRSLGKLFDDEVRRVCNLMPDWIPPKKGKKTLESFVQINFDFAPLYFIDKKKALDEYNEGVDLFEKKKFKEAITYFSSAINLRNTFLDAYYNRAMSYLLISENDSACFDLNYIRRNDFDANEIFIKKCENILPKDSLNSDDEVWQIVEVPPKFPGGETNFYNYVAHTLGYPVDARRLGIQGRVFVQFVILEDGSVAEAEVIRGIGGGCDEEALRVIKNSPHWIPGEIHGKPVKVRMILPITFKLN